MKSDLIPKKIRVLGAKGSGSVIAEAFLALADIPYVHEEVNYQDDGPDREKLLRYNPVGQVPTLILSDGSVLTETMAVAAYTDYRDPELRLIPRILSEVGEFWRWCAFLVSAIYPTFTYGDYPRRWVKSGPEELVKSTGEQRKKLWMIMEHQAKDPYFLGTNFSAIDIYLMVMRNWGPRRKWFDEFCPKISRIADNMETEPALKDLMARNFPSPTEPEEGGDRPMEIS
jgi:GST-like protein